jgi:hypothetical protein
MSNATDIILTDIDFAAVEDACAIKILAATRPDSSPARPIINKVEPFRGERDEVFAAIIRESAPSVWMHLHSAVNNAKEFEQAMATGQPFSMGTTQNRLALVWSFYVCAQSLRAPRELTQGGPGVYGAYQLMRLLIGQPDSTPATPGRLRGWQPLANFEPFVLVGWELLGQSTTAVAYDLQFRTRVQL